MHRRTPSKQWSQPQQTFSTRRHPRRNDEPISTAPRTKLPSRRIILAMFSCLFVTCFLMAIRPRKSRPLPSLRDQPDYTQLLQRHHCRARLCEANQKCSAWLTPGQYNAAQLAENGVPNTVAYIDVEIGCEMLLKTPSNELKSLSYGRTDCAEKGCQSIVEVDLKSDLYIFASQLELVEKDQTYIAVFPSEPHTDRDIDVTLISQFSVNRLDTFAKVIEVWQGPISVAIYLTESDDANQLKAFFSQDTNLLLYSRISITVLKPNYSDPERTKYPINHLRNLAITASATSHIYVFDADFVPSQGMYTTAVTQLLPLIAPDRPTAIVIPCFAIKESFANQSLPTTTAELQQLYKAEIAYITDPNAGHGPTLAVEMALSSSTQPFYEVCYESQWEPYYIVPRSAPLYDVRFTNQGGDKQSHALQLNAHAYRFMVARHVFMLHRDHPQKVWPGGGFEASQNAPTKWGYFGEFMHEMQDLYGAHVRWPRGCSAVAVGIQVQRRSLVGPALLV